MAYTVLVVEDTQLLRRMYCDRLTQDGFRCLQAADGLDALAMLRSESPDLILLDLVMPKMSGIEVLERVRKDPRLDRVPVLILSNLGQDEDIRRGMNLGAADYLIKNDSRPADISEKIKAVLASADVGLRGVASYRLMVRDHEADAERFISDARLARRFWCPACEVELTLELLPSAERPGWYDAHVVCPTCSRDY